MTLPTIHTNGTSREQLVQDQRNVLIALDKVLEAMNMAWPHGRDYFPQGPNAIREAQDVAHERCARVKALFDEINVEALAIQEAP